jgi:hypothetical protein
MNERRPKVWIRYEDYDTPLEHRERP